MKASYMFPLSFLGGAIGWPAVKTVLLPMIVWSSTIAGSAMYVKWVIKSHNANVMRIQAGAAGSSVGEPQIGKFDDDLAEAIAAREAFIWTHRSDDPNLFYAAENVDSMRSEDARLLAAAEQLRTRSSSVYTSEIAAKVEQLKAADDQLKAFGDQVPGRDQGKERLGLSDR